MGERLFIGRDIIAPKQTVIAADDGMYDRRPQPVLPSPNEQRQLQAGRVEAITKNIKP